MLSVKSELCKVMKNLKTYFKLMTLFKTPFIYLRANTWRIMQLNIDWHYFAASLETSRIGRSSHIKKNPKLKQ